MQNKKIFILLFLGFSLLLSGVVSGNNFLWGYAMSDTNFEYKTVCAGRYNIDIPDSFEIVVNEAVINGFSVSSLGMMSEGDFRKMVDARKAAYQAGVDKDGTDYYLLKYLDNPKLKILGVQSKRDGSTARRRLYWIEAYSQQDGNVFRFDGSVKFKSETEDLKRLERTVAAVRVGAGLGFCFKGGHFPEVQNDEFVSAFIRDPKLEGYGITLDISDEQHALKDRQEPTNSSPIVRPIKIDGLSGYVYQLSDNEVNERKENVIEFYAKVGETSKIGQPARGITLNLFKTGFTANTPPYGVSESTAIWNKVISSIRRR